MLSFLPTQKDSSIGFVLSSCMFHFPWSHDIRWFLLNKSRWDKGRISQSFMTLTVPSKPRFDLLLCYPGLASVTRWFCECGAVCKDREQNHVWSREYWGKMEWVKTAEMDKLQSLVCGCWQCRKGLGISAFLMVISAYWVEYSCEVQDLLLTTALSCWFFSSSSAQV